jgi:hypothetical protein
MVNPHSPIALLYTVCSGRHLKSQFRSGAWAKYKGYDATIRVEDLDLSPFPSSLLSPILAHKWNVSCDFTGTPPFTDQELIVLPT